jgi:hypothetical protein
MASAHAKLLNDFPMIVDVPVDLAHDHFVTATATGLGESDWSAIAAVSYRNAGLH